LGESCFELPAINADVGLTTSRVDFEAGERANFESIVKKERESKYMNQNGWMDVGVIDEINTMDGWMGVLF
jgi:hypothetical protein